jgi:hypothetical protein
MNPKRNAFLLYIDLDPDSDTMNTKESVRASLQQKLFTLV